MAAKGFISDCSICLQAFKKPKLLPCFHTFCADCLQSYIDKTSTDKRFTCPLCRKSLEVPDDGVSGFQSNYYIPLTPVIREENKCIPCDFCSETSGALSMCLQCDEYYCETCTVNHRKLKATRDHEILDLDQDNAQSESRIRRKTFCPVHNEEIAFDCNCKMQICLHCKLTTHSSHTVESIVVIAGEIRKQIKEILLSDRSAHAKSRTALRTETCCRLQLELDELEKRELNKVETRSTELKNQIDEICNELKTKITKNVDIKRKSIKEDQELAEAHMASIQLLCSTAERMVKMADDIVIVDQGRALYQNLTECFTDEDDVEVSLPYIEFKKKDLGIDVVRSYFGDIIITKTQRLVSSFVLECGKDIDGLCLVDVKTCWVANNSCKLSLVDLKGEVKKRVTFNTEIDAVTSDTDGSLFISSYNSKSIQKYTTQEQIVDVCSLQFQPTNMAFNHMTDKLIVSSPTGIYTVSRDGNVNRAKFEETVFQKARCLAIDETGTFCISDWKSRAVTFLDDKKKKKSTYTGTGSNFSPNGVCCDKMGKYYVVDVHAKLIHVLRSDGSLVYNFSTEENLPKPLSIVIHGCHLWVGHFRGHISVYDMSH